MIDTEFIDIQDIQEVYEYLLASHTKMIENGIKTKRLLMKVSPIHDMVGFAIQYPNKDIISISNLEEALEIYNKIKL